MIVRHTSRALLASLALALALPLAGPAARPAAAANSVTITWEDYFSGCPTDPLCNAIDTLRKQYQASHPGVTIERTTVPFADLLPKVLQQAATHTLPDVLILDNPQVQNFASTGALADLTSYAKGWSQLGSYYSSSLSTATWQGKLYGVPIGNNDLALYYNKKMLKAAGIGTPPTTWAALRADAKKLTHGNVYGMGFSANASEEGTFQWETVFWGDGGDLLHVADKPGVEALTFWTQLIKDGSVSKSSLTWGQTEVENQFVAGNVAMQLNGPWNLPALRSTKGLDFGVAYMPRKTASMPPVSALGGEVWTVPASTPAKQQAAWNLIKWMQNPAYITKLDSLLSYLPAYKPANQTMTERDPVLKVFGDILPTSKARAAVLGPKYPKASEAIYQAIQSALSGSQTPQQALQTAQSTISGL